MQQRYAFHLITGRGRPVCEAYLQRLNQTVFEHPPYCTRPESAIVPGFELLHRRPIGQTEFLALKPAVELLLYKHPSSPDYPPKYEKNYQPMTWRYDPPVSVENNGQPNNLVIWDPDDGNGPLCGFPYGPRAIPEGGLSAPFVLSADDKAVDLAKTQEIFGRPNVSHESNAAPVSYDPLGKSVSIFVYRGTTYFDSFLLNNNATRQVLKVYARRHHATRLICGYELALSQDQL